MGVWTLFGLDLFRLAPNYLISSLGSLPTKNSVNVTSVIVLTFEGRDPPYSLPRFVRHNSHRVVVGETGVSCSTPS